MKVIRNDKNPPRERQSTHSFVWRKSELNWENDIKFIQKKWEEKVSKRT